MTHMINAYEVLNRETIQRPSGLSTVTISTTRQWAGGDVYRVETLAGGRLDNENTRSFATEADAADFAAMVVAYYQPTPDTVEAIAPAVEQVEPRTPTLAALANLEIGDMAPSTIAARLGVSVSTVYRWKRGGTPNATNLARLQELSNDLAKVGDGCGCKGSGVIFTGDRYADRTIIGTFGRCACNPA